LDALDFLELIDHFVDSVGFVFEGEDGVDRFLGQNLLISRRAQLGDVLQSSNQESVMVSGEKTRRGGDNKRREVDKRSALRRWVEA